MFSAVIAASVILLLVSIVVIIISLDTIRFTRARRKRLNEIEAKIAAARRDFQDGARPRAERFKL